MRKQRLLIMLSVIMIGALIFTGCKKSVGTPEDNATKEEAKKDAEEEQEAFCIGFSAIDMGNPYFITLENAVREVLEEEGHKLVMKDPGTDPDAQASQIQEMIAEGIDAIILSPVDWEAITPSLQELKGAGVKIVNADTQVKEMEYIDAYIGSDNYGAGAICGEDLIERRPDGGKVALLECPTQNSINERITGFEEAFERALDASERILKEDPDIVAIMCGNDQLAVGATTAANVAGLDEILIYGVDGSPDIKKELKKAETQVAGTAAQSPINIGKRAAKTAINMLKGEAYEREVYEEVFMIDKDNVDMYGTDGWQ